MRIFFLLLILAGFYPLFRAWQANRHTSLCHAVFWAGAAWVAWGVALVAGSPDVLGLDPWRYFALCVTAAAGVAVLGARRPHVEAWDFVVLGLLAVMLLPLGENLFLGTPPLDGLRLAFLAGTLAASVANYVVTSAAMAALLLGAICAHECLALAMPDLEIGTGALNTLHVGLLLVPWLGLGLWRRRHKEALVINQLWHDFRDRYGLFWAQRVRDEYNRGAAHAGLPGFLFWHGWEPGAGAPAPTEDEAREMQAILQALLKRFGARDSKI
jgi:hypothetical protein